MNALGSLFFNEMKEYEQAFVWFRKAAEKGFTKAITNLGICYELGLGIDRDWDQAQKLYQESSKKGHLQAMYNLGYLYFQMGTQNRNLVGKEGQQSVSDIQFGKASKIFIQCVSEEQKSTDKSEVDFWTTVMTDCHFYLGQMFQYGWGVLRDMKTALRHYKKATQIGNHALAFLKCGDYYYSQNMKQNAMVCYQKAADRGEISALNNIALMLENGFDQVLPDIESAMKIYKTAHNKGCSDATINIAFYYLSGKQIEPDQKIGKALLTKALVDKNSRAIDVLLQFGLMSRDEIKEILHNMNFGAEES